MENRRPNILRRQLLVDRAIQIPLMTYSVAMAMVGVLLAALMGSMWVILVNYSFSPPLTTFLFLAGSTGMFVLMIVLGLLVSNRIAGPLLRLRRHMQAVADGEAPTPLRQRDKDYTGDLFIAYNNLLEKRVMRK